MNVVHPVPAGTGEAGERLWHAVVDDFELAEHELALLRQAVAVADACETLQAAVDRDGLVVAGRPNALLSELRQQRILLARLVVALRVPIGDAEDEGRTQRRGIRGVYGLRAVPS